MFENLMELLERIAVSLEKIAEGKDSGCKCGPVEMDGGTTVYATAPVEPEVHPSEVEIAEADAAYNEREAVKAELREKGIKFKETAKTETLKKLLETPAQTSASYTKDDVRDALVNLSASKGKDAALDILRKLGGADKLSDVKESTFKAIVEACNGSDNQID